MPADTWDPAQYERFERERSAPFFDLLDQVEPCPGGRVVDLGCGTGELTRTLHERTRARSTLGLDASPAMLERSAAHAGHGLTFEHGDIAEWAPSEPVDLVFSNAALHWIDDHDELFARLTGALAPGGQLAVQMPANHDHPSHLVAERVAAEEPFRTALGGYVRRTPVLAPERYALLLHRLGYGTQHVRLHVYLHVLTDAGAVVDWVKGTLLTDYRRRLPERVYEDFVNRYRELLVAELPDQRPFPFSFKRVLLWGRLSGHDDPAQPSSATASSELCSPRNASGARSRPSNTVSLVRRLPSASQPAPPSAPPDRTPPAGCIPPLRRDGSNRARALRARGRSPPAGHCRGRARSA